MFYVYKITNSVNGKIYIGKTKGNADARFKKHLRIARGGKAKYFKLYFALHTAINKYGSDKFIFEIIQTTDDESKAFELEKYWISKLKNGRNMYNLTDGGEGTSGSKRTDASKKLMSLAHQKENSLSTAQLTINQVIDIKKLLTENKIKMAEIAKLFSVSFKIISNINRGITWSWVKLDNFIPAKRIPNVKLTDGNVRLIKKLLKDGISYRKIASQFEVSVACIQNIKNGRTFSRILID